MRILLQRVTEAAVRVGNRTTGSIQQGLLLLVGVSTEDDVAAAELLATKVMNLRIFEDHQGKMNLSALDLLEADNSVGLLVVSQFTLYADTRKGRRPSFVQAARPDLAVPLLAEFVQQLERAGFSVQQGEFGAEMAVHLINDGPVTIWLDSDDFKQPRS